MIFFVERRKPGCLKRRLGFSHSLYSLTKTGLEDAGVNMGLPHLGNKSQIILA